MNKWERLPDETTKAYQAFCLYRDIGHERNIRAVAQKLDKNLTTLGDWSKKYGWVDRAQAYDDYLDSLKREVQESAFVDMAKQQAQLGKLLQEKAMERLETIQPSNLSTMDIVRFAEIGAKIEQNARGLNSEEITSVTKKTKTIGEILGVTEDEAKRIGSLAKAALTPTSPDKE